MRVCPVCRVEVPPIVDLGDDHVVVLETPMELDAAYDGDAYVVTVSRNVRFTTCSELRRSGPAALLP